MSITEEEIKRHTLTSTCWTNTWNDNKIIKHINIKNKKEYNFSGFITFLSEHGFTGKLPCDIRILYEKPANSLHGTDCISANLKFLKDCVYELNDFNHLSFKPCENVILCIRQQYKPTFYI